MTSTRWCWSWWTAKRSPIALLTRKGLACRSIRALPIALQIDRGARGRARERHHPSRSETRQHQGHVERSGQGARLRPRESLCHDARRHRRLELADHRRPRCRGSAGVILGTAAYMSPEQARGKARGCAHRHLGVRLCVYEMLDRPRGVCRRNHHRHPRRDRQERARLVGAAASDTPVVDSPTAQAVPRRRIRTTGCMRSPTRVSTITEARNEPVAVSRAPAAEVKRERLWLIAILAIVATLALAILYFQNAARAVVAEAPPSCGSR